MIEVSHSSAWPPIDCCSSTFTADVKFGPLYIRSPAGRRGCKKLRRRPQAAESCGCRYSRQSWRGSRTGICHREFPGYRLQTFRATGCRFPGIRETKRWVEAVGDDRPNQHVVPPDQLAGQPFGLDPAGVHRQVQPMFLASRADRQQREGAASKSSFALRPGELGNPGRLALFHLPESRPECGVGRSSKSAIPVHSNATP